MNNKSQIKIEKITPVLKENARFYKIDSEYSFSKKQIDLIRNSKKNKVTLAFSLFIKLDKIKEW